MRYILLTILSILLSVSKSESQKKNNFIHDSIISQLKDAFAKQDYDAFFKCFPNNFQQFLECYGYENYEQGKLSLYSNSGEHIEFLFSDSLIKDKKHVGKLVSVAIDGSWDADAPAFFQIGIKDIAVNYSELLIEILMEYTDEEIEKFWSYILYEPYPHAEDFEIDTGYIEFFSNIKEKICAKNERMDKIVQKAYKMILDSSL